MACKKCGAPCQGRFCQPHRIMAAHEGIERTEGTRRMLAEQREDTEDGGDDA